MTLAFQPQIITLGLAFPCAFNGRWVFDMKSSANRARNIIPTTGPNGNLVAQLIS